VKTIQQTINFIKKAHSGQKYGSDPYWTHPVKVAETGVEVFGNKFDRETYLASLMHDVVEDTNYTLDDLREMGYTDEVLNVVNLVTKIPGSYEENIQRIIRSGNRRAMMVKFADNLVNYTGDKSTWEPKRAAKSQAKYLKSMNDIGKALGLNVKDVLGRF
jgi:GTP diphosphokinase / guanosine-3',5'-bis(diphosphate) 3'-diphosphatase